MQPTAGCYRFDGFTFDPQSGELEGRSGITRLQPQTAALLAMLVERAGTVVSRAELQARLWPETTVEFDDGLNFCVRQLRLALGDDATAPRYIETLPKRGYRFLPAVTAGSASPRQLASAPGHETRSRGRRWIGIAIMSLLLIGGGTVVAYRTRITRLIAGQQRVVLAILPFSFDASDPMMAPYQQRVFNQLVADARRESIWTIVGEPTTATHILSASLTRKDKTVQLFVQLVVARDRRHLWADDMVDTYAFSGNSTLTADRIERSVARILGAGDRQAASEPR